jgi:RNA polymerase sigma-32 factor
MPKISKLQKEKGQGVKYNQSDIMTEDEQEKKKPISDKVKSTTPTSHNLSSTSNPRDPQETYTMNIDLTPPLTDATLINIVNEGLDDNDLNDDDLHSEDLKFGLEDDDELTHELEQLGMNPLRTQLPSMKSNRGKRKRLSEFKQEDQLPARRPSNAELIAADELSRYLNEVRRYPLLDREEEKRLAENYFHDEDRDSAKRLVTGNLRLVVKIAKQYRRAWVNIMDLIQEGNIGLGEAVKRFDPYRGVRFSSFARYWIRALILQFILKNFRMVSFANTRAGRKLFFRLEKERTRLMQLYGEATTAQLALALDVSEEDIETAMRLNQPVLSLDAPRYHDEGDGDILGNMIQDDAQGIDIAYEINDYKTMINEHIQIFGDQITDERERIIWDERLLCDEPESLAVLGERFNVTRERVRQLELRLKKRLKAYLDENLDSEITLNIGGDS